MRSWLDRPVPLIDAGMRVWRAWLARDEAVRARSCSACGFDLLHTPGATCPECGSSRMRACSWRTDGAWSAGRIALVGALWGSLGGAVYAGVFLVMDYSTPTLGPNLRAVAGAVPLWWVWPLQGLLMLWFVGYTVTVVRAKKHTTIRRHLVARGALLVCCTLCSMFGVALVLLACFSSFM